MSAITDIHTNDIGTVFIINISDSGVPVDLSGGTSASNVILFKRPDRTTFNRPAVFDTDGKNGRIKYVSVAGDISMPGVWYISARVNTENGQWVATADTFTVHPVFE